MRQNNKLAVVVAAYEILTAFCLAKLTRMAVSVNNEKYALAKLNPVTARKVGYGIDDFIQLNSAYMHRIKTRRLCVSVQK